jgi:Peptidase A4 family/Ricin-type beta-trefoil lectin domain-like
MFLFTQRFGRDSRTKWRGTGPLTRGRRRNHRLNCEALESRQLLSGYYIVNAASGKVLDDPGFSTNNGTPIDQWQLNGGANQQWNIVSLPDGNDDIVNAYSNLLLDDPEYSLKSGTQMIQYQNNGGGTNQEWGLVAMADGNYEIVNTYSRMVLDDPNSSNSNGTSIGQWQSKGGLNQQWVLLAAGNAPAVTESVVNAYSGMALDDPNSSTSNRATIDQWPINGGTNQQWTLVPLADGYDEIVNEASGLVLDDPAASTSEGTFMDQWQLNGGMNQQWQLIPQGNGNYAIINGSSGYLVLDDTNFSRANGTAIDEWPWNRGMNQQWVLYMPNTTAATSPNWSGYVDTSQNDSVTYVAGTWTVPTVTATSGDTTSFAWVGIDGWNGNGTVEQTGTAQGVSNGVPYYFAWWEMWSTNGYSGPGGRVDQRISSMTVSPGDSITASVTYESSGTYAGDFLLSINDTSQPNDSFSTYENPSVYQDPLPDRSSAEWIMETPTVSGGYATLPNFGSITFTNCNANVNGTPGQAQAVNLSSNVVASDTTSVLTDSTDSGWSFTVLYNSAGTAGQSDTNANVLKQSGPTVKATQHPGKKTDRLVRNEPRLRGPAELPHHQTHQPVRDHQRNARAGASGELSSNAVTYDTTSALADSGTSFVVLYNSAATAGQSGTHANGLTQIGPDASATLRSGKKTGSPVIGRPAGTGAPGLPRFRRPTGQHERFAQGYLIDPRARHVIVAESDSADR